MSPSKELVTAARSSGTRATLVSQSVWQTLVGERSASSKTCDFETGVTLLYTSPVRGFVLRGVVDVVLVSRPAPVVVPFAGGDTTARRPRLLVGEVEA